MMMLKKVKDFGMPTLVKKASLVGLAVMFCLHTFGVCFRNHHGEDMTPDRCMRHVYACLPHISHHSADGESEHCNEDQHHGIFYYDNIAPVLMQSVGSRALSESPSTSFRSQDDITPTQSIHYLHGLIHSLPTSIGAYPGEVCPAPALQAPLRI